MRITLIKWLVMNVLLQCLFAFLFQFGGEDDINLEMSIMLLKLQFVAMPCMITFLMVMFDLIGWDQERNRIKNKKSADDVIASALKVIPQVDGRKVAFFKDYIRIYESNGISFKSWKHCDIRFLYDELNSLVKKE